jgi:branched-chain amino acid transport system permease protein
VKKNLKIILILIAGVIYVSQNPYFLFVSTLASINAVAVLGLNLISGYTGQLHLGQAAFMGIGAYTSATLCVKVGFSFWFALPIAILFSATASTLLGIPALKLRGGPYLALVTQTFGELVYVIILNWVAVTGGPFGCSGIKPPSIGSFQLLDLKYYFFFVLSFLILAYWLMNRIIKSKFGRVFLAIKESEDAAQSIGINTMKYKILAFVIAGAFGGIAGTLYAPFIGFISPEQFTWMPSLFLISMAIVGGLDSLPGGILGAFILTFLPEVLRVADQYRLIIYGVLLVLTLTFLPNGLISLWGLSPREINSIFNKRFKELLHKKDRLFAKQL